MSKETKVPAAATPLVIPAPKLPRAGASGGKHAGKRLFLSPHLASGAVQKRLLDAAGKGADEFAAEYGKCKPGDFSNPRRDGTHGWHYTEVIREAVPTALTGAAVRAGYVARVAEHDTGDTSHGANHLDWNLKKGFVIAL